MTARRLAVAGFLALIAQAPPAFAQTLAEGLNAYRANQIADAERILGQVAADPTASAEDRAEAQRELGRIDWLVRGETDAIAAALAATPEGEERCPVAALALRVYREAGQPARALAYGEAARAHCAPSAAEALHVELARAYIAHAAANPAERAQHLAAASAELDATGAAAQRSPQIAGSRLTLAIQGRNAEAALTAWRNYYWLTDADAPQAMAMYAGRVSAVFAAALAPNALDADILALLDMLIRAGFVDDARLFARDTGIAERNANSPDWRRLDAFLTFNAEGRAITLRANREMAGSTRRAPWYEGEIIAATDRLMQAVGLTGDPREALEQAYGVHGTLGETGDYPSLHAGHMVQNAPLSVSQYGRTGELPFIVIDNMMANGFESWLWDGWAQTGGWSRNGEAIVQVRSAFTRGPLSALRQARPGPIRDRHVAEIERSAAAERASLERDGVATLPATSERLSLQAFDQIAARVGDDDAAFIAEYWRGTLQFSIELHEGRHALDQATGRRLSDARLEYNAKLSQIALADYPRLGLANISGVTLDNSGHGRANRRILTGYRNWMRRHRDEIAGFDRTQPTLTQLHLLTDDQIRTIARSLDAWAREEDRS